MIYIYITAKDFSEICWKAIPYGKNGSDNIIFLVFEMLGDKHQFAQSIAKTHVHMKQAVDPLPVWCQDSNESVCPRHPEGDLCKSVGNSLGH